MRKMLNSFVAVAIVFGSVASQASLTDLQKADAKLEATLKDFSMLLEKMTAGGGILSADALKIRANISMTQKNWAVYAKSYCEISRAADDCMINKINNRVDELETQKVQLLSGE